MPGVDRPLKTIHVKGCLTAILVFLIYVLSIFGYFLFSGKEGSFARFHAIFFTLVFIFVGVPAIRRWFNKRIEEDWGSEMSDRESRASAVNSTPDPEVPPQPKVEYQLEDFFKIEEIDGFFRVYAKNLDGVEDIHFGGSSESIGICYNAGSPAFYFAAPDGNLIGFQPSIKGVMNTFCDPENIVQGQMVAEIDTRKETIADFERRMAERRRKREEEEERDRVADRIRERHRRRELEKMVEQELIDRGEILPSAKRPPIPKDVADAVYRRDGGRCVYCGSQENLHFDHIIPFSKGGDTSVENLQLLCRKCNLEKSNKIG